jgi:hypothetical protein
MIENVAKGLAHTILSEVLLWKETDERVDGQTLQGLIADLCAINTRQWNLEDEARKCGDDIQQAATLKSEIGKSNLARFAAVRSIDMYFLRNEIAELTGDARIAHRNSESLGQLLDRLSVVLLKRHHVETMISHLVDQEARREKENLNKALSRLDELYDYLKSVFQEFRQSLRAGRAVPPPFADIKLYGGHLAGTEKEEKDG